MMAIGKAAGSAASEGDGGWRAADGKDAVIAGLVAALQEARIACSCPDAGQCGCPAGPHNAAIDAAIARVPSQDLSIDGFVIEFRGDDAVVALDTGGADERRLMSARDLRAAGVRRERTTFRIRTAGGRSWIEPVGDPSSTVSVGIRPDIDSERFRW